MRQHGLQMMASAPQERARDRRATFRRLFGELHGYNHQIVVVLLLIVLSAGAQAAGPWLISRAIDRHILRHDLGGLSRLMVVLFVIYVSGSLANRAQIRRIGAIGQSILAGLRQQIFDRLERL
ncbi:MAG TPA: hypothetical protein VFU72_01000, partial [Nitrolancea sp.]|nr:hypothetical protein [Nitrolancea sp.]